MNHRILCLLFTGLLMMAVVSYGQYEDVWAFGTQSGMDFRGSRPKPVMTRMGVYPGTNLSAFGEGNASICDDRGELLFYTEGYYVWNKNGEVMPNGVGLMPIVSNNGYSPTSSTSQGAVIVPMPESKDRYYIFSLSSFENWQKRAGELYYSIIDMSLGAGLGDVVPGQKAILLDTFLAEKMTAVRGDRCNMWLLVSSIHPSTLSFKSFEVTAAGVNRRPVISDVGLASAASPIGTMVVSPDGKTVLATQSGIWGGANGAALFSFDPATGRLSDKIALLRCCGGYGASFAPDNTKAYVNAVTGSIYQYDLRSKDATTIVASETEVGKIGFSHLKLAADGKIYFINRQDGMPGLGVIASPNSTGASCNFVDYLAAMLPGQQMHAGLPNSVPILPYSFTASARQVYAPCWANATQISLEAMHTDGWDYLWNDSVGGASRTLGAPGIYWVSYKKAPCSYYVDTVQVYFPKGWLPDVHIKPACKGANSGNIRLQGRPGDTVVYRYTWRNSSGQVLSNATGVQDLPSGLYTLQIQTATCDTMLGLTIPDEDFKVSFLADTLVCQSSAVAFNNTSDSDFVYFLWDFGTGDTSSDRHPQYSFPASGSYQVQLRGIGDICTDQVEKTIIVDPLTRGDFVAVPDSVCSGQQIVFYTPIDSSVLQKRFRFGDGSDVEVHQSPALSHAFHQAGHLPVHLTTRFRACPDVAFLDSVFVMATPTVDLGPDTGFCTDRDALVLRNRSKSSTENLQYQWSTGDTSRQLRIVHPGTYHLALSTRVLGCKAEESIRVGQDCYVDIPNVFTPDGDGHNDYFFPRQHLASGIVSFSFELFNRYGQLLFSTHQSTGRGWDGTYKGQKQPRGVYIYTVSVLLSNGRQEHYSGNVSLLR